MPKPTFLSYLIIVQVESSDGIILHVLTDLRAGISGPRRHFCCFTFIQTYLQEEIICQL
jgi:hypothetical protein